ncbi:MAG: anaerobic ribonucleoside-triphosphate reductase activating protein [Kiritimatiellae bacterium]|nr:anaerobic ribonucleoside-triphosphate reductase activating protein [Kiritimatiellia bacterium]
MSEQDMGGSSIYGYLKNPSMVDYPGCLAAVFFTSGCNFTCGFCHNATLMGRRQEGLALEALSGACVAFRESWVTGAVITGGEPTLCEDLPDLIRFFKSFGWCVKLDTNGSMPDRLETCLPLVDYVAMDVKAGPEGYPELTGYGQIDRLRRSIALIRDKAKAYEFRTTIIEEFHDETQMAGIADLVQGAQRYIIQPFIPSENLPEPSFRALSRTKPETLRRIREAMAPHVKEILVRGD